MIYAGLVAGGVGSRMGADVPKQYLELDGMTILERTVRRFLDITLIDRVIVGVSAEWLGFVRDMFSGNERVEIVEGGNDRTQTVFNILSNIKDPTDKDIILTHDAVRPFVSAEEISDCIKSMEKYDGTTLCIPSTDTLVYSNGGERIEKVCDRAKIFRVTTPQTFRLKKLIKAYNSLDEQQKAKLTDTASVFTTAGLEVGLIRGSESNIKLTTPFDMTVGKAVLECGKD